jgi:hypothetical protein
MRLFTNLPLILLLVVTWPMVLLGFLKAAEWLERTTLAPRSVVPRRFRRMKSAPPEQVEAMVLKETAEVVAEYWSATGESPARLAAPDPAPAPPPGSPAPVRRAGGGS